MPKKGRMQIYQIDRFFSAVTNTSKTSAIICLQRADKVGSDLHRFGRSRTKGKNLRPYQIPAESNFRSCWTVLRQNKRRTDLKCLNDRLSNSRHQGILVVQFSKHGFRAYNNALAQPMADVRLSCDYHCCIRRTRHAGPQLVCGLPQL